VPRRDSVDGRLSELPEPVLRTIREILAPLVEADAGVLYVVSKPQGIRLHLAGACGGCPGVKTCTADVLEPALRAAGIKGDIEISAGWIVPEGAERITGPEPVAATERESPLRRSR
jgi:Fe-S cluster biogenesis protein NfuA